jgi:hypothetical protein
MLCGIGEIVLALQWRPLLLNSNLHQQDSVRYGRRAACLMAAFYHGSREGALGH